jgi:putative acyl-CoA dehydrogenase
MNPISAPQTSDNQPPPLLNYNAWTSDALLRDAVRREGGEWVEDRAESMGALIGSERMAALAYQANHYAPELRTHDRWGRRIDLVDYHPAYHELMALAFGQGLHSLAWTAQDSGACVARAALFYLWNQGENGVACPVTMSFAARHMLRSDSALAAEWEPKLLACDYDPRPLPIAQKRAVSIGMAMTEKQGGSDLRANETCAIPSGDGAFRLQGHKWFCSAPMSDAFFTLARTDAGLTCFFVPRSRPDGVRNAFLIQRLKDKCGNRSNASAEIEYLDTYARIVGQEGRGIATLIEMAHLTRFDIVVATAGMMRAALNQAIHHASHRQAFGKRLVEHALMLNVLADLSLEVEAALHLAFRLARAFDEAPRNETARRLVRLMTPIAKYWLCKRNPMLTVEAMECLGGNGYVEDWPLARLYRDAPLNGIWEGSGNLICLDVLRCAAREPETLDALIAEIGEASPSFSALAERIAADLRNVEGVELRARRIVEMLAIALQASLMTRYAAPYAADAFVASRLNGDWGRSFGTLPPSAEAGKIVERARIDA